MEEAQCSKQLAGDVQILSNQGERGSEQTCWDERPVVRRSRSRGASALALKEVREFGNLGCHEPCNKGVNEIPSLSMSSQRAIP